MKHLLYSVDTLHRCIPSGILNWCESIYYSQHTEYPETQQSVHHQRHVFIFNRTNFVYLYRDFMEQWSISQGINVRMLEYFAFPVVIKLFCGKRTNSGSRFTGNPKITQPSTWNEPRYSAYSAYFEHLCKIDMPTEAQQPKKNACLLLQFIIIIIFSLLLFLTLKKWCWICLTDVNPSS